MKMKRFRVYTQQLNEEGTLSMVGTSKEYATWKEVMDQIWDDHDSTPDFAQSVVLDRELCVSYIIQQVL